MPACEILPFAYAASCCSPVSVTSSAATSARAASRVESTFALIVFSEFCALVADDSALPTWPFGASMPLVRRDTAVTYATWAVAICVPAAVVSAFAAIAVSNAASAFKTWFTAAM